MVVDLEFEVNVNCRSHFNDPMQFKTFSYKGYRCLVSIKKIGAGQNIVGDLMEPR